MTDPARDRAKGAASEQLREIETMDRPDLHVDHQDGIGTKGEEVLEHLTAGGGERWVGGLSAGFDVGDVGSTIAGDQEIGPGDDLPGPVVDP